MKTTKRYIIQSGKIRSLQDISLEKQRLKIEITKTEENIQSGYHDILQAFTLKNLATTLIDDISTSSSIVGKAFAYGKSFITKRKKKKQDKVKEITDEKRS